MNRDRRFKGSTAYVAYGMKWTRTINRSAETMTWRWRKAHRRLTIRRNPLGDYFVVNGVYSGPYRALADAFLHAANVARMR